MALELKVEDFTVDPQEVDTPYVAELVKLSGDNTLDPEKDYEIVENSWNTEEIGEATGSVEISGKGKYEGSTITIEFEVTPKEGTTTLDLDKFSVSPVEVGASYTANALKCSDPELKVGTDYEVLTDTWNASEVGENKGSVKVKAVDGSSYSGTITIQFDVKEKSTNSTGATHKPKPEQPADEPVVGTPTTMYRLYNKLTGEHLYMIDKNERDNLLTSDTWKDEGEG
ncbi:MAG: hypothetical protein K2H85_07870 [Allobaculum sp.]|nr:hypothetical protein [Allobaculum sp.]